MKISKHTLPQLVFKTMSEQACKWGKYCQKCPSNMIVIYSTSIVYLAPRYGIGLTFVFWISFLNFLTTFGKKVFNNLAKLRVEIQSFHFGFLLLLSLIKTFKKCCLESIYMLYCLPVAKINLQCLTFLSDTVIVSITYINTCSIV